MEPTTRPRAGSGMSNSTIEPMARPRAGSGISNNPFRLEREFKKTTMCGFFLNGCCAKDKGCTYAHSVDELRVRPDLTKTVMCRVWLHGQCGRSSRQCKFAHGEQELRVVGRATPVWDSPAPGSNPEGFLASPPTSPTPSRTDSRGMFLCPPCTPNYPRPCASFRPQRKRTPSSVSDVSTTQGYSKEEEDSMTESDEAGGEEVEAVSSCKNRRQGQMTVPCKPKTGDKDEKEPHMASMVAQAVGHMVRHKENISSHQSEEYITLQKELLLVTKLLEESAPLYYED